jgi:hypothetical protein
MENFAEYLQFAQNKLHGYIKKRGKRLNILLHTPYA